MFYVIGLGLCDEKDITVRGLEVSHCYVPKGMTDRRIPLQQAVKSCSRVYLEAYTSILLVQQERLVAAPAVRSAA
jgi:diphthine synthase